MSSVYFATIATLIVAISFVHAQTIRMLDVRFANMVMHAQSWFLIWLLLSFRRNSYSPQRWWHLWEYCVYWFLIFQRHCTDDFVLFMFFVCHFMEQSPTYPCIPICHSVPWQRIIAKAKGNCPTEIAIIDCEICCHKIISLLWKFILLWPNPL